MRKWCFPGNIFHMRNADEGGGLSGVEIAIQKIARWLQELMMVICKDKYFRFRTELANDVLEFKTQMVGMQTF